MEMWARAEELARQMDSAFAEVPMPEAVVDSGGLDEAYVVRHFAGKRVEEIAIRSDLTEDLMYMSAEAIHYFLPAFLK